MAILDFDTMLNDLKTMNAIDLKTKWGIEKEELKSILDKLWLNQLWSFSKNEKSVILDLVIELAKNKEVKFFDIPNKELFKAGLNNGKTYTKEDIEEIAKNTNKIMKEFSLVCPIKLGHDGKQELAKELEQEFSDALNSDGMPAFGYVDNIKAVDGVLIGDFKNIPEPLYNLIEKGMFSKRSAELWLKYTDNNGNQIGKVFSAIALLGAEQPAIPDLHNKNSEKEVIRFSEETNMTELEKQLAAEKAAKEKAEADKKAEFDRAEKAEKDLADFKADQKKSGIESKTNELLSSGIILPFEKDAVQAVLTQLFDCPDKVKFTKKDGEKELNLVESFCEVLKARKGVDLTKQYAQLDGTDTDNFSDTESKAVANGVVSKEEMAAVQAYIKENA